MLTSTRRTRSARGPQGSRPGRHPRDCRWSRAAPAPLRSSRRCHGAGAAAREEGLLEGGIDPGAGDNASAVEGTAPGEESALALDVCLRQHALVEQRAHEHVQQALVLANVVLEPRDALLERAAVRRLGDAEEVVVVATLLTRILDDRGLVGRVD